MMRGLLILLVFQCGGELIKLLTGAVLPGSVIGLLLLFLFLLARHGVPASVDKISAALIARLPLLLTVPSVGLFFLGERMRGHWLAVLIAVIVGTAITLLFSAVVMAKLMQRREGAKR
jgi:holin-like protein